jgi:HPt (histidine-containing phosphotransfer) domain-containing protein
MGILKRVRSSRGARLIGELASVAASQRLLADRLHRHAHQCSSPAVAAGLEELAEREAGHERALSAMVARRGARLKAPEAYFRDGANNWERISADLELFLEIHRALSRQVIDWEDVDALLAAELRQIAEHDERNLGELRTLALKLDPQALD